MTDHNLSTLVLAFVLIVFGIVIVVLCAATTAVRGETHTVWPEDDINTIQAALDQAAPGDTIIIMPGGYDEQLTISTSVTLTANERGTASLIGNGSEPRITVRASGVTIDGLMIYGPKTSQEAQGIDILGEDIVVQNCTFWNNRGNGVYIENSQNVTIRECMLYDTDDSAIAIYGTSFARVSDCMVMNTTENSISLSTSDNCTVTMNTLQYAKNSAMDIESGCSDITISFNSVSESESSGLSGYDAHELVIMNNTITECEGNGIYLNACQYSTITGNTLRNNDNLQEGYPALYLKTCAHDVVDGNTIDDNEGTGVYVYRSPYTTIRNNSITDSYYNGIYAYASQILLVIDNYLDHNDRTAQGYPCIYLDESGLGTIAENTVKRNGGSGIYSNQGISNTIRDNHILDNGKHGIWLYNSTTELLSGNNCSANYQNGLRIYKCTAITIEKNEVLGNSWSGIYVHSSDSITLSKNRISENRWDGVYIEDSGAITLEESTIIHNDRHGAFCNRSSALTFTSNTFEFNTKSGIYLLQSSAPRVFDNIFNLNYYGITVEEGSTVERIDANIFSSNLYSGLWILSGSTVSMVLFNEFTENGYYGIEASSSTSAPINWWGDSSGPYNPAGEPYGDGDSVTYDVETSVWLTRSLSQTPLPLAFINAPGKDETVYGEVSVIGLAYDRYEEPSITVIIDGARLATFTGAIEFQYSWDTTIYEDGPYTITVEAINGTSETDSYSVRVYVDNSDYIPSNGDDGTDGGDTETSGESSADDFNIPWSVCIIFIVISVIVTIARTVAKRSKVPKEQHQQPVPYQYTPHRQTTLPPTSADKTPHSADDIAKEQFLAMRHDQLEKIYTTTNVSKVEKLERIRCWKCREEVTIYEFRCVHCGAELR